MTLAIFLVAALVLAIVLWQGVSPHVKGRALRHEQDLLAIAAEREAREHQAANAYSALRTAVDDLRAEDYLAASESPEWIAGHREAVSAASLSALAEYLPTERQDDFRRWCGYFSNLPKAITLHNENVIARQMQEEATFFERALVHPLTQRQREAIITNEDTTLVVAGAGTGKTSVIAGKVAWLLHRGLASPAEILVLAYNKKAAEEAKDRLASIPGADGVMASTMHAFGLSLLARAAGEKPTVSTLADDRKAMDQLIQNRLMALLTDPAGQKLLADHFSRELDPGPEPGAGTQSEEHWRDMSAVMAALRDERNQPITVGEQAASEWVWLLKQERLEKRDLTGQKMKSRQEVKIANWLTLNGIRWEYERPYSFRTATMERRQYQPDFYLPDHDLWIEHYGIGRHGETAKGINRRQYRESMEWKRTTHLTHGTVCIETFGYQDADRTLFPLLERELRNHGVVPRILTAQEIARIVYGNRDGFYPLSQRLGAALSLFRGSGMTREQVQLRAASERDRQFLTILFAVLEDYEAELNRSATIDFDDMILQARAALRSRAVTTPYRFILVDEFQDITENRLGLLQDVRSHNPHARLFVVGDDW